MSQRKRSGAKTKKAVRGARKRAPAVVDVATPSVDDATPAAVDAPIAAAGATPGTVPPPTGRFTPQMQAFCDHYLSLGCTNATEAARRAKYSAKRAQVTASELLARPEVQEYIQAKRGPVIQELAIKHKLTMESVIEETANMVNYDATKLLEYDDEGVGHFRRLDQLPESTRRCIGAVKTKEIRVKGMVIGHVIEVKPWSKDRALDRAAELLAKIPVESTEMSFSERAQKLAAIIEAGISRKAKKKK
jgi:phage terminase small subunit